MEQNNAPFKDNSSHAPFPIVAIGASAGGLNALQCFMAALPKDFGFTVVFMQHLSPTHKSLLPALLHSARPDIDVTEISDGMEVVPGRIYLCPPGKETKILKETFCISDAPEDHIHLPIDEFFMSLAEEAGERVIAVIFSGAGTDGARGLQAVRATGGTVFVQDPAEAEFSSMPLAAINTGQVDGVLTAGEIAGEILKLYSAATAEKVPDSVIAPEDFDIFYRLVREKTGLRFDHYKKSVVGRRIRRRMYLRGVSSFHDYARLVSEKDSEAVSLASDLMIGVTSFFRDRLAWKALKTGVIRKLAAQDEDSPARIWTPACATGEESYSVAMVLQNEFELAGRKREIQVFATDVNDRALKKAREGKYPGSITADVPPDFMKKYFVCSEDGNSVIITKEVREKVVFAKQDILSDPPFSRLDLVICRNLLIYTGFAELLKKRAGEELDEKSREYVDFISEAAVQMGKLIDDLLAFSRTGRVEMKRQHMHTEIMLRGVIRSLGSEAAGRDVEWKTEDLPDVSGDPALLRLVWMNLISNALKFTRPKNHAIIEIGSRDEGREYVFYVKDNGVGFDMKFKDKLFSIFQRLHSPAEFEGTGVGLANVHRIITRHGGKVWAEGEEGEGAMFYFTLPK